MNIKQAEQESGVSRRNIRFYEAKGLLHPARNRENDYRAYGPEDVARLKQIRLLRMVDMPLDQIRSVLDGELELQTAASAQKQRLEAQARQLEAAIRFCGELAQTETVDPDGILARMDAAENRDGLFRQWEEDYRQYAHAQAKKTFTFVPEDPVTNPAEFTLVLCKFGSANDLDLTITKEGMYPEFTLDGVEYTAERLYTAVSRVPMAVVRCTAKYPELLEPERPWWKKLLFGAVHYGYIWYAVVMILVILYVSLQPGGDEFLTSWEGWALLVLLAAFGVVNIFRGIFYQYNDKSR